MSGFDLNHAGLVFNFVQFGYMAEPPPNPPSSVNDPEDEVLCPTNKRRNIKANNYYLDLARLTTDYPVILAILRHHPLYYALTATAEVPLIYLQQVWNTIGYEGQGNDRAFVGTLDRSTFRLSVSSLRTILRLPSATDGGRTQFENLVTDDIVCHDVHQLGYKGELAGVSFFNRNNFTPIWYVLFSILHRCLSAKWKGIDQCSGNFLHLFHAVVYNRHVDFAELLWREMDLSVSVQGKKSERKFVPHMRFLQLAIRSHMDNDQTIRRRSRHTTCPHHFMRCLSPRETPEDVVDRPIPEHLLRLANQALPCVKAYRKSLEAAPTVQPEPVGPSQGARPERSGPLTRGGAVRRSRGVGRGRSSESVRGTGVSRGTRAHGSTSSRRPSQPMTLRDEPSDTSSDDRGNSDIDRLQSVSVSSPTSTRVTTYTTPPHTLGRSIEQDVVRPPTQLHAPLFHSAVSSQTVVSFSPGILPHTLSVTHSESMGIETREQPPPLSPSFRALSSLGPFGSYSSLPRTPLFTSSVGSLSGPTGTSVVSSPFGVLQGSDGSPVIANTMPAISTGSSSVQTTVAASTSNLSGLGVSTSEFVSRETLDGALKAIQQTIEENMRQEFTAAIEKQIGDHLRSIKGKSIVTTDDPPVQSSSPVRSPTPPLSPMSFPSPHQSGLSIDDLKHLLYIRLLAERPQSTESQGDLISLLQSQRNETIAGYQDIISQKDSIIRARDETIRLLKERIASLEESCSTQTRYTRRRLDDQDDDDQHGEGMQK